jgi:glycosyltransferase involved in cell wall biosynthesis
MHLKTKSSQILIITGTYPPEQCGVGDYTFNMMQTHEAAGWALFYATDWSLKTFFRKVKKIRQYSGTWVNMQYPSVGYGDSILPHLLCLYFFLFGQKKIAVTIHEYTQYGWKGKIAMRIMFLCASKLIFTTSFERDAAIKACPAVARKSKIIKIFSNIKSADVIPEIADRTYDVGYFGYISPVKGIEAFLKTAIELKATRPDLKLFIMGKIQATHEVYAARIMAQAQSVGIAAILNQEEQVVADTLAQTKIVFLPFPDGISERRGSFLAAIKNGCLIVTTEGAFVTPSLYNCCEIIPVMQAPKKIGQLLAEDERKQHERQEKVQNYLKQEWPHSWNEVVNSYNHFLTN